MKLSPEHVRHWGASEREVFARMLKQIYGTDEAFPKPSTLQQKIQLSSNGASKPLPIKPWEKNGREIEDLFQRLSKCKVSIFYSFPETNLIQQSQKRSDLVRRIDLLAACWALGSSKSPFSWWENGTPNILEALKLPQRMGAVIDPPENFLESVPMERILFAFLPKSTDMDALASEIAGQSSQQDSPIQATVMRALAHRRKVHVVDTDAGFWVRPM